MKKYIITLLMICLCSTAVLSQQRERTADSVTAARTVNEMNQLFSLSPGKQDTLFRAGMIAGRARRQVYVRYWKTDSFQVKLARINYLKDSLYRAVLGQARFKAYRDTLMRRGKAW